MRQKCTHHKNYHWGITNTLQGEINILKTSRYKIIIRKNYSSSRYFSHIYQKRPKKTEFIWWSFDQKSFSFLLATIFRLHTTYHTNHTIHLLSYSLFYNINNKLRKGYTRIRAVFSWVFLSQNLCCELRDRLEEINPPFDQVIKPPTYYISILTYFLIGSVVNRLFLSDLVSWTSRLQKWEFSSIFKRKKKADIWM